MEPFVLYLEKTNEGEEIFNSYRKMREALQDFNIAEWQLEKGYRIPGTIYLLRTETLREKNRVEKLLKRYGLLNKFGDEEKKIKDILYQKDLILEFEKKVVYEN